MAATEVGVGPAMDLMQRGSSCSSALGRTAVAVVAIEAFAEIAL